MHNFIEWLAVEKVREAYLSRMPAFVLSNDLDHILWVNGSGALFFGTPLIMDLMGAPSQFDLATRNQIKAGQNTGRLIQLRGIKGRCSFVVSHIMLGHQTAWLITSLQDPLNRYARLPLIEGLNIDTIQSAIVDVDGEPLLASAFYNLPAHALQKELSHLDVGQNIQMSIDDNGMHYHYGAVRLDEIYFLVIENKETEDKDIEGQQKTAQPLIDKSLNDDERSAFREIADRLKQDISVQVLGQWPHENGNMHFDDASMNLPQISQQQGNSSQVIAQEAALLPHISPLNANQHDLENLLDLTTDGVIFLKSDLKIQSLTPAAEALLPLYEKNLIGELFTTCLTPNSIGHFITYRTDVDRHAFLNKGCEIEFSFNGKIQKSSITLIRLEAGGYAVLLYENGRKQKQSVSFAHHEPALKPDLPTLKPNLNDASSSYDKNDEHVKNNIAPEKFEQDWSFLARVAHEIRTPLNAMIGFAELMQGEKFGPINNQRYREYVRDIAQSGHYILSLVNDLLLRVKEQETKQAAPSNISDDYAKASLQLAAVDLGVIARDAVNLMHDQANRDGIMMRISFETRLPKVMADARTTKQIILNILSNSIRFTPKGGQIIVSAHRESDKVILKIKDTGVGMHSYELEKAMQPFEQIKPDHIRHNDATYAGTGLGLPLVKALVEENNGRFKIVSEHGEGTVVEIQFQQA